MLAYLPYLLILACLCWWCYPDIDWFSVAVHGLWTAYFCSGSGGILHYKPLFTAWNCSKRNKKDRRIGGVYNLSPLCCPQPLLLHHSCSNLSFHWCRLSALPSPTSPAFCAFL